VISLIKPGCATLSLAGRIGSPTPNTRYQTLDTRTNTPVLRPYSTRSEPSHLLQIYIRSFNGRSRTKFNSYVRVSVGALVELPNSLLFIPGVHPIEPHRGHTPSYDASSTDSLPAQPEDLTVLPPAATTLPLRSSLHHLQQPFNLTINLIACRFNEIQVTKPLSQANGVLSARINTRIKLDISFHPGSPIQFLTLPQTPSVHAHEDSPQPGRSLKFSLELGGTGSEAIIGNVCLQCKRRKDQATWDIVDFRAPTTVITIVNGTASIEFYIKCYVSHHVEDSRAFW
jgi:hypothetical protein